MWGWWGEAPAEPAASCEQRKKLGGSLAPPAHLLSTFLHLLLSTTCCSPASWSPPAAELSPGFLTCVTFQELHRAPYAKAISGGGSASHFRGAGPCRAGGARLPMNLPEHSVPEMCFYHVHCLIPPFLMVGGLLPSLLPRVYIFVHKGTGQISLVASRKESIVSR